ncbi:MAG: right-handed parallel beta-helix repeat-containing protein [Candidatus Glassbacteria bacterium]|nr:right-handed parallel beta-helix repeat-containing protein [Candidatus Glassbacteria bacterium]
MKRSQLAACLLALACFLGPAGQWSLYGRTMYLAPDGDDSVECGPGAAFRTLKRAVECLAPGDTLTVREGDYPGGVWISVAATAEAPVLIQGESLEAVITGSGSEIDALRVQDASHVIIDRLTVRQATRAGLAVRFSDHVRVANCRFADNGTWGIFTSFADDIHFEGNECCGSVEQHGIYHSNSGDRFVIRGNLVHDNAGNGIHLNGDPEIQGGDGVLNFGVVEGNTIYGNGMRGGGAINMTHVHDVLVRNNLIYLNYAGGITVYQDTGTFEQGSKRVVITGNTVYYRSHTGRSGVNIQTTSEKVLVAGNIFVSGGNRGNLQVESDHLSSIVSDCNVFWGAGEEGVLERRDKRYSLDYWRSLTGNDLHSVVADPQFTNIDSADFRPAAASPAVDAGMPPDSLRAALERLGGFEWVLGRLDSLPAEDIRGRQRPQGAGPDAGAYETGDEPTGMYDFNRDGRLSVADAVALILLARADPSDPAVDLNGDGRYSMADVIRLVLILRDRPAA